MKKKIAIAVLSFSFFSGLFFAPVATVFAQAEENAAAVSAAAVGEDAYEKNLEPCFEAPFSLNMGGCFARFMYFLAWLSSQFLRLTGEVFDYFLAYSIDSGSYQGTNNEFVERGWGVIRDIANVGFIFILLYIAISHILQLGGDIKKGIRSLIIAALLINFSLFFTKVIIDAGNILARAFYNNIEVVNEENPDHKSISAGIADKLEPQKLVSSELFNPVSAPGREAQFISSGWASLILGLAAFVNITLGMAFLSVFLLFAARVIGLWFMMIFSPIAFISISMPNGGGMFGQFSFSTWLKQTMSLSFMAPIFMFFLFLLVMFLEMIYTVSIPGDDQSSMQKIMTVIVPFIAVITIIRFAKDQAKEMSGKFGEALVSAVGKVAGYGLGAVGLAGGLVAGTAAAGGRFFIGGAASRELKSGVHQERVRLYNAKAQEAEMAGDSMKAANYRGLAGEHAETLALLEKRRSASFDVRRSKFLQEKVFGTGLGKAVVGKGGIGQTIGAAITGEKLNLSFGKGKETSVKKQEEETKKAALDAAKLYEVGAREEDSLALIGYTARKGVVAQQELIGHIDNYMDEIGKNELMTKKEKDDRRVIAEAWKERARTANTGEEIQEILTGIVERDADGKPIKENGKNKVGVKGTTDEAKGYARASKNAFADLVETSQAEYGVHDTIYRMTGLMAKPSTRREQSSVIADEIRKVPKADLEKSIKDLINESKGDKGGDEEKPKPKPPDPKPKPDPNDDDGA